MDSAWSHYPTSIQGRYRRATALRRCGFCNLGKPRNRFLSGFSARFGMTFRVKRYSAPARGAGLFSRAARRLVGRATAARVAVGRGLQDKLLAKNSCQGVQTAGESDPPAFHALLGQFVHLAFERLQRFADLV